MPPAAAKSSIRCSPVGLRFTSTGTSRPSVSKSSRLSGTPARPAIASRWTIAFVEPPIAAFALIAFSSACRVMIRDGLRSSRTISTARRPARCATTFRTPSTAGTAADPGS